MKRRLGGPSYPDKAYIVRQITGNFFTCRKFRVQSKPPMKAVPAVGSGQPQKHQGCGCFPAPLEPPAGRIPLAPPDIQKQTVHRGNTRRSAWSALSILMIVSSIIIVSHTYGIPSPGPRRHRQSGALPRSPYRFRLDGNRIPLHLRFRSRPPLLSPHSRRTAHPFRVPSGCYFNGGARFDDLYRRLAEACAPSVRRGCCKVDIFKSVLPLLVSFSVISFCLLGYASVLSTAAGRGNIQGVISRNRRLKICFQRFSCRNCRAGNGIIPCLRIHGGRHLIVIVQALARLHRNVLFTGLLSPEGGEAHRPAGRRIGGKAVVLLGRAVVHQGSFKAEAGPGCALLLRILGFEAAAS